MKKSARVLMLGVFAACLPILGVANAANVVWSENFDDGNANSRWYADFGVWQIGSSTIGPGTNSLGFRSHSGTQCATTGLNENYLSSQDSRLIRIASFVVPLGDQSPRLRFWHWFSFAGKYYDEGSYGWVEVKSGTNAWQQVSPTYSSTGSGVWSQPSIDLTAYAGQSVQIAFHFHSASQTSSGWYVDDVALVTGTPVFNNPEGFEAGMGDWSAESGTWEVGKPSSGPASAHSGTNCVATVLAGNYAAYSDSRFISPAFAVPAADSSPRLRFWHWFSFAGEYYDEGSYGWIEVKSGTNAWKQVSPTYTSTGSGVWSQPSIDLTAYAGQSVQIALHFHSASQISSGWYVDDLALVTGTPVFNNPEGFEAGIGDWSAESGTWEVGKPSSGPGSAHSGTNCAATVLAGNYAAYSDSRFISPPFVVPAAGSSPALRFWHWFSFAGQYYDEGSYGWVEAKSGTNAWQSLSSHYTGNSGAWTQPYFDLSPYAGQSLQIAFHFHSASLISSGWYIDDLSILNYVQPPAITSQPTNQTVVVGSPATFMVGASGAPPLAYQWYSNNVVVSGATSAAFTIPSVQMNDNGDSFFVVVSDSAGTNTSSSAQLTVLPWPTPWQTNVINPTPTPVPAPAYSNGVLTVQGSGTGIQGTTGDSFYFFHQTLTGDGQVVARLLSLHEVDPQGSDPLAEVGVMIRESLDPGSKHVFLAARTNALVFSRRLATDDYTLDNNVAALTLNGGTPCWLRLMRLGDTFVGLYSTNGSNWAYGWFTTLGMSNQVEVGVAVTSHHEDGVATGTLDSLTAGQLSPVPGWSGQRIYLGGEGNGPAFWQQLGGFKMLIAGAVGDYFSVAVAPNPQTPVSAWQSLGTVTNTWGVVGFLDPGALINYSRFYQAQRLGP